MRKMILSLGIMLMIPLVIWTAIAFDTYGSDIVNHHLNLEGMFIRFKTEFTSYSIYDDIKNIMWLTKFYANLTWSGVIQQVSSALGGWTITTDSTIATFLVNALQILISPINFLAYGLCMIIYITYSSMMLLITIFSVLYECLIFLFNPLFI